MPTQEKTWQHIARHYAWRPEFRGLALTHPDQADCDGETLLHLASHEGKIDEIKILLAAGATINVVGDLGNSPLMNAAMAGHLSVVQFLVESGADTDMENEFGETALNWASSCGHEGVAAYLLSLKSK